MTPEDAFKIAWNVKTSEDLERTIAFGKAMQVYYAECHEWIAEQINRQCSQIPVDSPPATPESADA